MALGGVSGAMAEGPSVDVCRIPVDRFELWLFFSGLLCFGGGRGAVFWAGPLSCLLSSECGGGGSAGDGAGRCRVGCEPTLHRRLRPGSGIDLCFLWMVLFRGVFLGCAGC